MVFGLALGLAASVVAGDLLAVPLCADCGRWLLVPLDEADRPVDGDHPFRLRPSRAQAEEARSVIARRKFWRIAETDSSSAQVVAVRFEVADFTWDGGLLSGGLKNGYLPSVRSTGRARGWLGTSPGLAGRITAAWSDRTGFSQTLEIARGGKRLGIYSVSSSRFEDWTCEKELTGTGDQVCGGATGVHLRVAWRADPEAPPLEILEVDVIELAH